MGLKIYDSLRKDKVDFIPLKEGVIGMYVCGITAYDSCHMGHARCYVSFDAIFRYLKYLGYQVTYVRNFTDLDDKIIRRSKELGLTCDDLTQRYIGEFREDMSALNVLPPDLEPRVTQHIPEIIELIKRLVDKGVGYPIGGDVYFEIDKYPRYTELSGRNLSEMIAGASERVEVDSAKRNPLDFALWKGSKEGEPSWESPWGKGRPGWHIECSAMSLKYLGEEFDIHGGGKDLIFPHHENEMAQSKAATGKGFAKYWLHNGFVNIDNEKMSKSLGNFFTIREVLKKYHPDALRYFFLTTHYRSPINYTDDNLNQAGKRVSYFYRTYQKLKDYLEKTPKKEGEILRAEWVHSQKSRFEEAMNDDFNTALAIAHLAEGIKYINELIDDRAANKNAKYATLTKLQEILKVITETLGICQHSPREFIEKEKMAGIGELGVPLEFIEARLEKRTECRQAKDWQNADLIRQELLQKGIVLNDTPTGTEWDINPDFSTTALKA